MLFHLGVHFFSTSDTPILWNWEIPVTSHCLRGRGSSCAVAARVAVQGKFFPLLLRNNFHVCGIHDRKWLLVYPEAQTSVPGD